MKKRMFSKTNILLFAVAVVSLILFISLNDEIHDKEFWFNLDLTISSLIPSIQIPFFITIAKVIAVLFDALSLTILSLAIVLVLWLKRLRKEAVFFGAVMIINELLTEALKLIIHRARPLDRLAQVPGYSFPSGHSAAGLVFFGLLIWLSIKYFKNNKQKYLAITLCSLMIPIIGFGRIYLNVHWLTDVLAGFSVGAFVLSSSLLVLSLGQLSPSKPG